MALQIVEFFGFEPLAPEAAIFVAEKRCPFTSATCIKPLHGSCSVQQKSLDPIICCPNRLYDGAHKVLRDIAVDIFGAGTDLIGAGEAKKRRLSGTIVGDEAVAFGKGWGGELPLPKPKKKSGGESGAYYVDWIIAKLNQVGGLKEFTAVEVQTIDTTGNYKEQSTSFFQGLPFTNAKGTGFSDSGMNWENVNKRILPQIIYKGHVLRREALCSKGLFFVCPDAVYLKIKERLGDNLLNYPIGQGTITFRSFGLGSVDATTAKRPLLFRQQFTTTVDQVATAFTSPMNLPAQDVYKDAINAALA